MNEFNKLIYNKARESYKMSHYGQTSVLNVSIYIGTAHS